MLRLQPELLLPKELEIPYPADFFEWIKSNLSGLRYVTFKKVIGNNKYDNQCCKIFVNPNASPTQIPEDKVSDICEKIYLILQYYRDEADSSVKFCITIYCRTSFGTDKPLAKHISVGNDSTGERESRFFDPTKVDGELVDQLREYIAQIHDANASLMLSAPAFLTASMEMNKELQKKLLEVSQFQVELKRIEVTSEIEKEEQKIRLLIERDKVQANKEKWENTLKQLNKNGALDRVMEVGSEKLFGMISGNEEIKKPPVKKKPVVQKPNEEEQERLKREQDLKNIEEGLKVAPLFTYCAMLKSSLAQDEVENGNDSVNKYIEDELPSGMVKDFQDLLNSENESEAKTNLRNMHSNLSEDDFPKLLILRSRMNDVQKKIITSILKFLESEEE